MISHLVLYFILITALLGPQEWIIYPNFQMRKASFSRENEFHKETQTAAWVSEFSVYLPGKSPFCICFSFEPWGCLHLFCWLISKVRELKKEKSTRMVYHTTTMPPLSMLMYMAAAATAAKLSQSCPTLCNPIDGSPPGSPVPGILQARTLEWVAISLLSTWK